MRRRFHYIITMCRFMTSVKDYVLFVFIFVDDNEIIKSYLILLFYTLQKDRISVIRYHNH